MLYLFLHVPLFKRKYDRLIPAAIFVAYYAEVWLKVKLNEQEFFKVVNSGIYGLLRQELRELFQNMADSLESTI